MDAKDLRTESALSERNNDGSKYSQSGGIALHCDRNKSYQDIGSNSLAKVDVQSARPCAVIGPDRVVPPSAPNEAYLKKGPAEPWPCMDGAYHTRRPPEYPHKLANFQNPTRNISPRQTFQENMQRIMVPPSYNSVKISDDTNYVQLPERSNALPKNIKINVPPEAKFCDVPYTVYPSNEQKNVRNAEMCISSVNPGLTRTGPHGWPPNSVNIRPTRTYGAPELYQYQEYPSCAGPRPVVPRPNRTVPEEAGYVYADPFYHQEGNVRFKPYPTVKDRFPQQRYEYIGNYANSFHPPPAFPTHKYEIQKTVPPHPYPPYPPIKYLDRPPEPVMEGYQRNQQGTYNIPYRNQIIHPNYGPVLGNCPQNKIHSYPPDAHLKSLGPNKMPFDSPKAYIEYENGRPKMYPPSESYLVNEMGRVHSMKSQVIMPNYPTINMHNIPPNPYYKKDNQQIKNYEYLQAHFRPMDPNMNIHNSMIRHAPVFSPNTSAISPTDSSTSNDTSQTLGTSQEDCGYVSQSSTASARSVDSGINRISNDCLRKYYDSRYGPIIRTAPMMSKSDLNVNNNPKEKKNIDVRQFLQMWNEGDEETEENNSKEIIIHTGPKTDNNFIKAHEVISQSNQEQLYVLGLVNVPSEELGKYEHIQKVSKLPENIKGYNHIELLNQFEEAIESSNMTNYKASNPKDFQMPSKVIAHKQTTGIVPPRPLSPLDVEAKISQSVIHKEVGCNFEIKPCSPKMLNVEVATPVQNLLAERAIEKVANPVMLKSPRINGIDDNLDCNIMKRKEHRVNINNEPVRIPSCKMVNTQFSNNNSIDSIKNSYSLQDLESNSGLCLASLPRLDNDIELNFPEVNQQFINANKGDSSVATSLRDLPTLELLDQSDNQTKDKLNDLNSSSQVNDVIKSPSILESEKEFSKLSKYRKNKTLPSDSKENQINVMSVINAARTDSVIIKNPENVKKYEEKNSISTNCLNKQISDIQQVPINLTSQNNIPEETIKTSVSIAPPDAKQCKDNAAPIEIAIDFSLNKNNSNENIQGIDIKNVKQSEILTQNIIEENQSTLDDDNSSKLPTFPDSEQNIQDAFINNNNSYKNDVPNPIKCRDSDTVHGTKDKVNLNLKEDPPLEEIFTKDKCLEPIPDIKEMEDVDEGMLSLPNVNEINNVNSNSLLAIEFVSPAAEILKADSATDSYLMDVDKENDTVDSRPHKSNYNLNENNLDQNVLKDNDKFDNNDIANNDITNIGKNCIEESNEKAINKILADSKLDIETSKDNINQIIDCSMSDVSQNVDCINFDLSNSSILELNNYQSSNKKQSIDSNLDKPSPNNVSQDDYRTYTENQKDIVRNNSNNLHCHTTEQDADMSSSLPNDILSPEEYVPDLAQQESDPNLKLHSLNDTLLNTRRDDQSAKTDTDAELPRPNNISTDTLDGYQSKVAEPATLTLATTQTSVDEHADTLQRQFVSYSDLPSPSNIVCKITEDMTKNNGTSRLLEKAPDSRIDFSSTEKIGHKDIFADLNLPTSLNTKLPAQEERDRKSLGVRYLAYGRKEMYSPWFQKLVLFCEGSINSVSNDNYNHSYNSELTDTETTQMKKSCDFDYSTEKDEYMLNNISHCKINNSSPKKDAKETLFNDFTSPKKYADVDINMIETDMRHEGDCQATESKHDKIVEAKSLHYTTLLQKKDQVNTQIESTHNHYPDINNKTAETSSDSSSVNHIENHGDKTNSPLTFEEVERNISPDDHEQWDVQSNCSDVIPEQWDKQSYCSDHASNELDKSSDLKGEISEPWTKQPNNSLSDNVSENLDNQSNQNYVAPILWDNESNCEISVRSNEQLNCNDDLTERWDDQSNCSDDVQEQWDKLSNNSEGVPETWDKQADYSGEVPEKINEQLGLVDNLAEKQSGVDHELADKQSGVDHDLVDKQLGFDDNLVDKQSALDDDLVDKQSGLDDDLVDKQSGLDDHFVNKQSGLDDHLANELSGLDDDLVDKQSELDVELVDNQSGFDDHFVNQQSGLDDNFVNKQSVSDDDLVDKQSELDVELMDKQSVFDGDFVNKQSELDDHFVNKQSGPDDDLVDKQSEFDAELVDNQLGFVDDLVDKQSGLDDALVDKQLGLDNDVVDKQSGFDDDSVDKQTGLDNDLVDKRSGLDGDVIDKQMKLGQQSNSNYQIPIQTNEESNYNENIHEKTSKQAKSNDIEIESSITIKNEGLVCTKEQTTDSHVFNKKRQPLKRSLSDSALNAYNNSNDHSQQENEENVQFIWPFKRRKMINNDILAQDLCNIIQNNRRNSISAIYNEENVSFCILIDNGCIITEEENDEQDKICYTELSEECLAEIQNESTKDEEGTETLTEVMSDVSAPQQENNCEYSDSFIMQDDEEKLEETWVEDVACVETVISEDIAEDIEISEPLSPKDDILSDNDESGVFSSSDHTDKVKYIYGDKMCNDDAQFVETLYNTPQMDVNKTLVQRETLISGEYYDNDSLEKILSESNDQDLSPYVPDYVEPVYSPRFVDVKETVENKENMVVEIISPMQNKTNALDVVDTGIDKIHQEDIKLCGLFNETQDDTVHSCESSVDNVFTYKENDEDTHYTPSSPEVSSTTSEEKKSAILLKITSYQGSRISQINDINRDSRRPSCKFTEDKGYVQSQSNFSTHRPLLTKAAQKYIPPLKESMRDLKVKLSLPQHSLMKLKQLKNSKDEPKLCKPSTAAVPRISKKPKPKFEDVLKSIDEIQIKMHKEKNKKSKKSIPKVVIKKNENGSHYASTSNKEEFNPDLTGRKWQPWVFIEKNHFIDKMAMKKKTKAIYSHRKRTYVLAEKFQKYKSVNSGKFVISPPISDSPSAGLKYTIRLKHNY